MDLASVKPTAQMNVNQYTSNQGTSNTNVGPDELTTSKATPPNKSESSKNQPQDGKEKDELTREGLGNLTEQMNKFMTKIDADLRFEIHEETDRIMVKFVNKKDNQVIKEFPPHELLDTLAAIRDYVGILLDKRV